MTGKNIRVLGPYRRKLALQVLYGKVFGAGTSAFGRRPRARNVDAYSEDETRG